jgi:hypothetical protein
MGIFGSKSKKKSTKKNANNDANNTKQTLPLPPVPEVYAAPRDEPKPSAAASEKPKHITTPPDESPKNNAVSPSQTSSASPTTESPTDAALTDNEQDPYKLAVNMCAVYDSIFNAVKAAQCSAHPWGSAEFVNNLSSNVTTFENYTVNIRSHKRLKHWIEPVHYRSTGVLLRQGRSLEEDLQNLKKLIATLKSSSVLSQNPPEKRQLTEILKNIIEVLWRFYCAYESVVFLDILEQSKIVKKALDTISEVIEENSSFETNYRRFTQEVLKLARLVHLKSLQQFNSQLIRDLNDAVYTLTRATKVIYIVGKKVIEESSNEAPKQNLRDLIAGLHSQLDKINGLSESCDKKEFSDPSQLSTIVITSEMAKEFADLFAHACKEFADALNGYINKPAANEEVVNEAKKILQDIEIIKEVISAPNNTKLSNAVTTIANSIQIICVQVYRQMPYDIDTTHKGLVLYTLQTLLHYGIQLQLVACMKLLYYLLMPYEVTVVAISRHLLLSSSLLLQFVTMMGAEDLSSLVAGNISHEMEHDITTILHYGRSMPSPLAKSTATASNDATTTISAPTVANNNVAHQNQASLETEKLHSNERDKILNELLNDMNRTLTSDVKNTRTNVEGTSKPITSEKPTQSKKEPSEKPIKPVKTSSRDKKADEVQPPSRVDSSDRKAETKPPASKPSNAPPTTASTSTLAPAAISATPSTAMTQTQTKPSKEQSQPSAAQPTSTTDDNAPKYLICGQWYTLPPGHPPPPFPKPEFKPGGTREEYKAYMIARYEYEAWENSVILAHRKLAKK